MYNALSGGQIRLLSIAEADGLIFKLEVVELVDPPPYIALSYTWGKASYRKGRSDSQTYPIYLDESEVHVDQNLHDALRYLCSRIQKRHLYLWVDRVCINQTDLGERSSQVMLMNDIYGQATRIYGWLGQPFDEHETRLAVQLMNQFRSCLVNVREKSSDKDVSYAATDALRVKIDETHDLFPKDRESDLWIAWDGIAEMLSQSYWKRLWIYQEATTLGSDGNKVMFFCGQHHFDRQTLQATCFFGAIFSKFKNFDRRFVNSIGSSTAIWRIISAISARKDPKSRKLLADFVLGMKGAACTDPRDRIYAPLAQATDVGPGEIRVDYTRSLADVYAEAARFFLLSPQLCPLEVLSYCYTPAPTAKHMIFQQSQEPSLPSWVPDWRHRVLLQRFSDSSRSVIGAQTLYNPLPGKQIEVKIEGSCLSLEGFMIGESSIKWLGDMWEDYETAQETPRAWRTTLIDKYASVPTLDEMICRSLVGDSKRITFEDEAGNRVVEWERGRKFDWSLLTKPNNALNPEELQFKTSDDMVLDAVCFGRRLALLTGNQIAVLPAAASVGDEIAAFSGGKTLYLLRRVAEAPNTFSLIGECYVDGLMDGQLLRRGNGDTLEMERLRLV